MIRNTLFIILAIGLTGCINKSPDQSSSALTDKQMKEKIERCSTLKKQVEDLKGKPVRRSSAREYYAVECLERTQ